MTYTDADRRAGKPWRDLQPPSCPWCDADEALRLARLERLAIARATGVALVAVNSRLRAEAGGACLAAASLGAALRVAPWLSTTSAA